MTKKKSYEKGEVILTLSDLMAQDFVFWGGCLTPLGWFQNWQMSWAQKQINQRQIRKAVKQEDKHE